MGIMRFPYTNLHELNLDWILEQLNQEGAVLSINDKHGIVVLTGEDIKRNSTTSETIAQALSSQGTAIQTVRTQIGTSPLPTTAQSLTGAIAENAGEIADLQDDVIGSTSLPTTAQTLTGAIAENAGNIGGNATSITNINNKIGSTSLPTTAQTLTGAVAELNTKYTGLRIEFGDNTQEITPNLQNNWASAVPNDGKTYFVKISVIYGDYYGTICRYSSNYGTGIVSRYDGRVYRIQMNNGVCSAYQLQNRPIQIVSTGEKVISSNGNISYSFANKSIVLGAYCTSSDIVCTVYPSSGADASGNTTWWVHCRNANSAGAVASGNITCYLIYIDMT